MLTITTEATLRFLWVNEPSFVINGVMNARSGYVWQNSATKRIVFSIGSIDSFSVVDGVIELLTVHLVFGSTDYKSVVKGDLIGEVVGRWIYT